jgi:GTPase SAR1 family protein
MIEKEAFIECVNRISGGLEKGVTLIAPGQIAQFDSEKDSILGGMEHILDTNRTLKIGIVGEVKAGKSSFLNALVFDGEEVLPKAATPMTAALTKLNYSESPKAEIFFYKDSDWRIIERLSDKYEEAINAKFEEARCSHERSLKEKVKAVITPPPTRDDIEKRMSLTLPKRLKECRELTRMAEKRGLRPADLLGKKETIPPCESIAEYNKQLNEYIGAEGTYTPLVSHTELYIHNDLLKDIEIIDTPGLNDAVVSRSQKTKDFLKECDVVFLLSYVGEFLLNEDIQFIVNTLPDEAIEEAVLVGSKFDSGVLQYKKKSAPFKEALNASRRSFDGQAEENIKKCARGPHPPVIDKLASTLPCYISSLLYSAAKKKKANIPLTKEESAILEQLKTRFSGFSDDPDFLFDFSGIARVRDDKLSKIRKNKVVIIKKRVDEFLGGQVNKLAKILEDIKEVAQSNHNVLKDTDVNTLHERLEKLNDVLGSIRGKITRVFLDNITKLKKSLSGISLAIANDIDKYNKDVDVTTRIEEDTYTTGHLWWKKLHTTHTKINSANVSEVIGNIRKYVTAIQEVLLHEYDTLLDRQGLRDAIAAIVAEAHDLKDKNFNADEILLPIDRMLSEFAVASISIDTGHYNDIIFSGFSDAVVEDADINRLLLTQEKVLQQITRDIKDDLEREEARIETLMRERSETFISDLRTKIGQNYEVIAKNLEDKEKNLGRYDEFIEELTQYQRQLRAL